MTSIQPATKASSSPYLLVLFLLIALATPLTHALNLDRCTISLAGLLGDAGLNQCLPFQSLSRLLTDSITPPLVNDTATDFCVYPDCSSQSISLVQNTVVQNCLDGVDVPNDPVTAQIVYGVASLYPPMKQGLCQRIPNNGTFCVTEFAQSLGDYVRANPSPLGIKIFMNSTVLMDYVSKVPKEIFCTDCNKAIVTPLTKFIHQNMLSLRPEIVTWAKTAETATTEKCGASFLDGQMPNLQPSGSNVGATSAASTTKGRTSLTNILSGLLLVGLAMLPL